MAVVKKATLRTEYNLKVIKNPRGLGWVIQDVTSHGLLTRKKEGGLYLSWYAKYNSKLAKSQGEAGWCNNGSLWPSQQAAQSFLDQILGATQAIEKANEMATHALAWAIGYGYGDGARRPFKDFLIRRALPSDGWTDDDWVAEGRYQDTLTKMPIVLLFKSGPTVESLAKAIREQYETENIWVDQRPEVPDLFQVERVAELPKTALPTVMHTPLPKSTLPLISEFVPGSYAVFSPGTTFPRIVKIHGVEFEAPQFAGQSKMEVYYTFAYENSSRPDHSSRYHEKMFFSVEGWRLSQITKVQETYAELKKKLDLSVGEVATESPVVSTDGRTWFFINPANTGHIALGAKTYVAFQILSSFKTWSFTDDTVEGLRRQILTQYPNAKIRVDV
jgi:hypothetical protein